MKPLRPLIAFFAPCGAVLATPSGLNNIPTADTPAHRVTAVQAFSSFGGPNQFATNDPGQHSFWVGFKSGLEFKPVHLEFGLDSPLGGGLSGPLFGQVKLAFQPWEKGRVAIGVANIALTDTARASDPFSYAILSHDFGLARFHAGYGLQTGGNTFLFGLDRSWKVFQRNLNLNADIVQTRDQRGHITALGAKYDLTKHVVLESWVNFPDRGETSAIAKINFIFQF